MAAAPQAVDVLALSLAYSPGGLAEMSLIALAMGREVALVAFHHVLRVFGPLLAALAVSPGAVMLPMKREMQYRFAATCAWPSGYGMVLYQAGSRLRPRGPRQTARPDASKMEDF